MRGRADFPNVVTLFTFFLVAKLNLFGAFAYGYFEDTSGVIIAFAIALVAAILSSTIARKNIKSLLALAGLYAGFSLGAIFFAIAINSAGSGVIHSKNLFICGTIFAIIGCLMSVKYGQLVVIYGTALFGSYTFMHGWALLFGGLPDELEMFPRLENHDRIKLKEAFTVYTVVFIGLFTLSSFIQRWSSDHEEISNALDDSEKPESHVEMEDQA